MGMVSIMLHSYWLVWLTDWNEMSDLPRLHSINIGGGGFYYSPSFSLPSIIDYYDLLQVFLNFKRSNLAVLLSTKQNHLDWTISLLFDPLISVITVSVMLHPSHWLVWLIDWIEFTGLSQLQSVYLGYEAFYEVHSIAFESDQIDGLTI